MANQQQLDIETQINQAIKARAGLLEGQKGLIADQIALAQELCRALDCEELDGYNDRIREARQGLLAAADAAEEAGEASSKMSGSLKKSGKGFSLFKGLAVGAAVGIKNAFGMVFNVIKGIGSFIKTVLVGAFKVVMFLINGWTKMLSNMAQKGMEAANAGVALRNAWEEVKHVFGGMGSDEGQAVGAVFEKLKRSTAGLNRQGITFTKLFGRGPDGAQKALEYVSELAQGLGASLDRMADQFVAAADEVVLMSKSLGFTGEEFAALGVRAGYTGESLKGILGRLSREVVTVSKNLGVNSKVMADNLKIMMKSPLVFGMNTKEMIKTSVAAQKLGVSIEQLKGPMSVFDDFESAAQNAADLAGEFGIMVDATEMMSADPADQFTMLKDAINASGRSFEDMSRQEKRRLAELSGMDPDALFKAMDPSNAFDKKAQDSMSKGVDKATRNTIAQTAATKALSKQIKLLHEAMSPMNTQGGFWGVFTQGIQEGLMRSEEGRAMLKNVTKAFKAVHRAGREVGKMLGELFRPGNPLHFLFEYFENLPVRIAEAMPKVKRAFRDFIDDLNAGGDRAAHAFANLFGDLKGIFLDSQNGVFSGLMKGFHALGDLIVANMVNLIPYVLKGFIAMFEGATAMMNGKTPEFADNLEKGTIMPMTQRAFASLMKSGVVEKFGDAFMCMLETFWGKYGDTISEWFTNAITTMLVAALVQTVLPVLAIGLVKGAFMPALKAIGSKIRGIFPGGKSGVDPAGPETGAGGKKGFLDRLKEVVDKLANLKESKLVKAGKNLMIIGGAFGLGVIAMAGIAWTIQEMGVQPAMMSAVAKILAALALVVYSITKVLHAVEAMKTTKNAMAKATLMIGLVAIFFAAVMVLVTDAAVSLADISKGGADPVAMSTAADAAGKLAIVALVVTAGIIGLGAVLTLIVASLSNPVTALGMAAGVAGAAILFGAAMSMVKGTIDDLKSIPAEQAQSVESAAKAVGMIVCSTLQVLDAIWTIMKKATWRRAEFKRVLADISNIVETMVCEFIPLTQQVDELFTADPEKVRQKLLTVTMLIDSFKPIAEMMTAALSIKNAKPDDVAKAVKYVGCAMSSIFTSVEGMITGIVRSSGNLTESQIKSATAAGSMLGGVTEMISGLLPKDTDIFKDDVRDIMQNTMDSDGIFSDEYSVKKVGEKTVKEAAAKQKEYIDFMVCLLQGVADPLQDLIKKVAVIDFGTDEDRKLIEKNMCTIAKVMQAVSVSGRAIEDMTAGMRGISGSGKGALTVSDFDVMRDYFYNTRDLLIGSEAMGTAGIIKIAGDISNSASKHLSKFSQKKIDNLQRTLCGFKAIAEIVKVTAPMSNDLALAESTFTKLQDLESTFTNAKVQPLIDLVNAYNHLYESTSSKLENMGSLNAVLRQFGSVLSLDDEEISIKTEQIKVEIKLNVTLDTKDIARALVEGEFVEGGQALRERLQLPPKTAK